jgi:hypothetical protein
VKGQREFARVGRHLCFKWGDGEIPIDRVLTLFTEWRVQYMTEKKGGKGSSIWWVKMLRKKDLNRTLTEEKRGDLEILGTESEVNPFFPKVGSMSRVEDPLRNYPSL